MNIIFYLKKFDQKYKFFSINLKIKIYLAKVANHKDYGEVSF